MSRPAPAPSIQLQNREDAGHQLAQALLNYNRQPQTIVVALPRGGVPVAAKIADALQLPLDVCLVRKLGVPGQPELAMGAIAAHGVRVLNQDVISRMGISEQAIEQVALTETEELQRRDRTYRHNRPPLNVEGQTVILVDDGVATGSTLRAAIAILRQQQPHRMIVAVPIAPPVTIAELEQEVDKVVCLIQPDPLYSISLWYRNFDQTSDETVCQLLNQTRG
ncbi:MAG TPA: phosphoribosyltransferase [Trichocoleus sp.]